MSNRWFRFYAEALNDPKVQKLPDNLFKIWVNTLCVACNNNGTLQDLESVSFALRLPFHETKSAFHELEKFALLVTDGETFQIKNWNKRQYKTDVSTERVKQFRKRKRNVSETPPDTDTEQIQNNTSSLRSEVSASVPFSDLLKIWNEEFANTAIAQVQALSDKRKTHLRARWRGELERDLSRWRSFCLAVKASAFLCGNNDRGWIADFEWAMKPDSIIKTFEGKYKNGSIGKNIGQNFGQRQPNKKQQLDEQLAIALAQNEEFYRANASGKT